MDRGRPSVVWWRAWMPRTAPRRVDTRAMAMHSSSRAEALMARRNRRATTWLEISGDQQRSPFGDGLARRDPRRLDAEQVDEARHAVGARVLYHEVTEIILRPLQL